MPLHGPRFPHPPHPRGLLGLPIPDLLTVSAPAVPSVPVLGPLVTDVVDPVLGALGVHVTHSSAHASTPAPAPTKSTSPPPSTHSSAPHPPSNPPSTSAAPGSGSGGGDGNPSQPGSTGGVTAGAGDGTNTDPGNASPSPPADGVPAASQSSAQAGSDPNSPASIPAASEGAGTNAIQNAAISPTQTGSASGQGRTAVTILSVTVTSTNADGSVVTFTTTSHSTFIAPATGLPTGPGGDGNHTPSNSGLSNSHKGLPSWAIGILATFLSICLLVIALLVARRRQRRKRAERRARWAPSMIQAPPSARSSFATHFDHGNTLVAQDAPRLPSPPPAAAATSRLSDASSDAQFVIIDRPLSQELGSVGLLGPPLPSPMSVRPFSPTESYKFPRPPSQSGASVATHSTQSTLLGSATLPSSSASESGPIPPIPTGFALIKSALLVRRPFAPALPDELVVQAGESVIVKDVFDDGWAHAQKADGSSGLLPLACFEENDQDVNIPAFMAAHKRQSSLLARSPEHYGFAH